MMERIDLKGVRIEELEEFIVKFGQPEFRASQILNWLYNHRYKNRVDRLEDMSNISKACYNAISPYVYITFLKLLDEKCSIHDKVIKFVFATEDNQRIVTVVRDNIIELSTQIGCSYSCKFCAYSNGGFVRNLTVGEIVDQVVKVQNILGHKYPLKYVHLCGMGEPLANYDNMLKAIQIINNARWGLKIFLRYFFVYTCGIIENIERLSESGWPLHLVVGLHSPDNSIRSFLMSAAGDNRIEKLLRALKRHVKKTGRRVILDYVLIEGLNDSVSDARVLSSILEEGPFELRISMYNPISGRGLFSPAPEKQERFIEYLVSKNIRVYPYRSGGLDIQAGMGQVSLEHIPSLY